MRQLVMNLGLATVVFMACFVVGFALGMTVAGVTSWECTPEAECDK